MQRKLEDKKALRYPVDYSKEIDNAHKQGAKEVTFTFNEEPEEVQVEVEKDE